MEKLPLKCIFPALPRTERGKFIVLGQDPRGKNFLYCNGKNVYIRDIKKPDVCDIYAEHSVAVSVAKYNVNGNYIASGDASGKVRIWDTLGEEHILKNEIEAIGGTVKDVSFSPDGDVRMMSIGIAGEGRETYARIVSAEMGTNKGSLAANTKSINAIAFRQKRPYRIVTASEDQQLAFFEGPPFKFKHTLSDHSNFVNAVRYAPNGDCFVSGGADGKAIMYDGTEGTKVAEFVDPAAKGKAHTGGIYEVEFSDDSKELLTVSGDKTAKIWDVASQQLLGTYNMGKEISDMQVGCLWEGDDIITVSLSGYINYLDKSSPTNGKGFHTNLKTIKGHNKPITAMAVSITHNKLFSGGLVSIGNDGLIRWDLTSGMAEEIEGVGHKNAIVDMTVCGNTLVSISMDDTIRYTDITSNKYSDNPCKLPSMPNAVASIDKNGVISIVACVNHIVVVDGECKIVYQVEVKLEPSSVDVATTAAGEILVAVGGKADKQVHIFTMDGTHLVGKQKVNVNDDVTDVKFSKDATRLAVGTGSKKECHLYDVTADFKLIYNEIKHSAKVFSLAWSPDDKYFASGSLDGSVAIWKKDKTTSCNYVQHIKGAHLKGEVKKVRWVANDVIVTCSMDSNIKQFYVNFGQQ